MKNILILIILTISICTTYADTAAETLVSKINNIQSMSANFTQKMEDSRNSSKSNGSMSLMKPHFFKWTTTSPSKQEIVSNGRKLWIYNNDLEQLIIKKASDDISQFPYLILLSKNTSKIDAMFNVTEKSNGSYQLTPKTDEMISNIIIKFDKNQNLSSLIITTSLHQNTKITFSNVKVNTNAIKDSQFNFITPKGADVIDASKG